MKVDLPEALQAGSVAIGDEWVERVRHELRRDNRPTAGGWPGTLTEARARTYAYLTNEDGLRRFGAVTSTELELLVRAVYERARNQWLANAQTDEDDA